MKKLKLSETELYTWTRNDRVRKVEIIEFVSLSSETAIRVKQEKLIPLTNIDNEGYNNSNYLY